VKLFTSHKGFMSSACCDRLHQFFFKVNAAFDTVSKSLVEFVMVDARLCRGAQPK
jgi:hypothetical protein